jgi:site-specific recombinase XerD
MISIYSSAYLEKFSGDSSSGPSPMPDEARGLSRNTWFPGGRNNQIERFLEHLRSKDIEKHEEIQRQTPEEYLEKERRKRKEKSHDGEKGKKPRRKHRKACDN